jgi:dTDP-4-dehydrorhamnose 3,5-epimerase
MIFTETLLPGAFLVDLEKRGDERGFFARTFCRREFEAHGLDPAVVQCNLSFNRRRGVVRGLHFQWPPASEPKLVRCTRGAILDVIVDLRPESPTYLRHLSVELTADNRRALYVPQRFAHGYQTLEDDTETMYQVGEFFAPELDGGLRHDDPRLAIAWPLPITDMSAKDRDWRPLEAVEAEIRRRMAVPARVSAG